MTGSGGWPMSVFLTPDGRPFYGGTYFPPDDRRGHAVLPHGAGRPHRRLGPTAAPMSKSRPTSWPQPIASRSVARPPGRSTLSTAPTAPGPPALDATVAVLDAQLDRQWGGFGRAPKFPQPALVDALLRQRRSATDDEHRRPGPGGWPSSPSTPWPPAASTTTSAVASARYSTDQHWLVPHFEKMLYDQAGLLRAFLHGWQVTGARRLPAGGRGHRRLRRPRPHPAVRRRVLGRGRRLRRGRGALLRLDPGPGRRRRLRRAGGAAGDAADRWPPRSPSSSA